MATAGQREAEGALDGRLLAEACSHHLHPAERIWVRLENTVTRPVNAISGLDYYREVRSTQVPLPADISHHCLAPGREP